MLCKNNKINTILKYKNFYEKHIYNKIHNKRLIGKHNIMYNIAGQVLLTKISKLYNLAKIPEPDFTIMKELGEFIAIHKTNSDRFWDMEEDYQINEIKKYLPNCIFNGTAYRFLGLHYTSSDFYQLTVSNMDDVKEATINKIQTTGIACCSTSDSFVNSIKMGSDYLPPNTNVIVRLTLNISNGIDVEKFWKELLKVAYENDNQEFLNDFGDVMGGLYKKEAEVIGVMNSGYNVYNWDEIYNYIQELRKKGKL